MPMYIVFFKSSTWMNLPFYVSYLLQVVGSSEPSLQSVPPSQYQCPGIQRPLEQRNSFWEHVDVAEEWRTTLKSSIQMRVKSISQPQMPNMGHKRCKTGSKLSPNQKAQKGSLINWNSRKGKLSNNFGSKSKRKLFSNAFWAVKQLLI